MVLTIRNKWLLRIAWRRWHIALQGAIHGRMIDSQNGVHTLEDAKDYMYKRTCERIVTKYERAKHLVSLVEELYSEKMDNPID